MKRHTTAGPFSPAPATSKATACEASPIHARRFRQRKPLARRDHALRRLRLNRGGEKRSQDQGAHGQTFRGGVFLMGERRRRITIFHA